MVSKYRLTSRIHKICGPEAASLQGKNQLLKKNEHKKGSRVK